MTPTPATGTQGDELASLFERVERKVREIQELQASRRRLTVLLMILFLGSALWFVGQVIQPFRDAVENPQLFLQALESEQSSTFLPILQNELRKYFPRGKRAVVNAFQIEWDKRDVQVQGLVQEFKLLFAQINKQLGQQAEAREKQLVARFQKRLEKDAALFLGDEEAKKALRQSIQATLGNSVGMRLRRPSVGYSALLEGFSTLQVPEEYRTMDDARLRGTMGDLVMAFLELQFKPALDNVPFLREILLAIQERFLAMEQSLDEVRSER